MQKIIAPGAAACADDLSPGMTSVLNCLKEDNATLTQRLTDAREYIEILELHIADNDLPLPNHASDIATAARPGNRFVSM